MIDIKLIREYPDLVRENIKKKFQNDKLPLVDKIKEKDIKWRKQKTQVDQLRNQRNKISLEISEAKKKGKNVSTLMKKAREIPGKILEVESKSDKLKEEIDSLLKTIPNIIHSSVPIGKDASENVEIKKIGSPKKFDFKIKDHVELAENLSIADFDTSAKTTGNGFYYLKGDLALLNQALIRYGIDIMLNHKYVYTETPLMIRKNILEGVYSSAEIDQMSYKIEKEDLYLIATSEHPLIGMFIDKTLKKEV